jgi:hypothetical protein
MFGPLRNFRCFQCKEVVNDSMDVCPFCGVTIGLLAGRLSKRPGPRAVALGITCGVRSTSSHCRDHQRLFL